MMIAAPFCRGFQIEVFFFFLPFLPGFSATKKMSQLEKVHTGSFCG
jgi:hypothetical protein